MLAVCMTGCGNGENASLTVLEKTQPASETESETEVTEPGSVPASASGEDGSEAPAVTTVPATTAAPPVTTTKAPDPVAIDMEPVYASAAWFSAVHTTISNQELKETINKLDEIISRYGSSLSFAYQNMNTGVTITYNTNKQYQTCSTVKAPYAKSLMEYGVDLDEQIKITEIYKGAAPEEGHINYGDVGKMFTVRQLIKNAIELSDNTAHMTLIKRFGYSIYNNYESRIGAHSYLYSGYYFGMCTAYDMLVNYTDIYKYSISDDRGKELKQMLIDSTFDYQISDALASKYPIAHKYGSDMLTNSYHDCAICYADSPFVLCIFSEQKPETEAANTMFRELALIFDKLNTLIVS